jgi:ADP-heptose:LPS heptosyltransferase
MNILVIRTHRFGDILQLTPMLRGLKDRYPESTVYFMVGKDFVPLLEGNPDVDAIIPIPEKEYRYLLKDKPERYSWIFNELYDLIYELRQKKFDLIINRQYEWGGIFAYLIGANKILGGSYSPEKGFYFSDQPSKELFDLTRNNRKANFTNLVDWACRIAGVFPAKDRKMYLPVTKRAHKEALKLLEISELYHDKPLVGIQMGAAKSFRQWGVENFSEIIQWLVKDRGKRVALIGSEDEKDLGDLIQRTFGKQDLPLTDLIGKTSLKTLGAVLQKCECLITGDTGSMHLAAAVGTPVLALFFGTAYPWETGPFGPGHFVLYSDTLCAPCFDPVQCKDDYLCKKEISPDLVMKAFEAAEAFWNGNSAHWEPETGNVKLYVTGHDKEGEQILCPLGNERRLPIQFPQRIHEKRDLVSPQLDFLLAKGDEVVFSFLEGDAEKGFSNFSEYLGLWMDTKSILFRGHTEMEEIFSRLLEECLLAMQNKDIVTLTDAIEYGFKPLVEGIRGIEKMNIEHPSASQAKRCGQVERPIRQRALAEMLNGKR